MTETDCTVVSAKLHRLFVLVSRCRLTEGQKNSYRYFKQGVIEVFTEYCNLFTLMDIKIFVENTRIGIKNRNKEFKKFSDHFASFFDDTLNIDAG